MHLHLVSLQKKRFVYQCLSFPTSYPIVFLFRSV